MYYTHVDTRIGQLLIAGDRDELRHIAFPPAAFAARDARGARPGEIREPAEEWVHDARALREASGQLSAYFSGKLKRFDLALKPAGTAFQQKVWAALQEIPYGERWSYRELAKRIGQPKACRAVGAANGRNPIPIVIPCHRVVGSDGQLTGFAGGLETKRLLLDLETC
jgi:methylated-DNA-[protein]-cysteine S-methyltransferase